MFKHKMIFYDQEGTSGAPAEPSPAPAPVATPADTGGIPRPQRTNVKSILDKAPVLGKEAPTGEVPKNEPEPLVTGPAAGKQPTVADPESKEPTTDESKKGEGGGESSEDEGKITIGGLSYSEQEWARFAKDYENDTTWRAANTKKSQVINKFNDELIDLLAPYALGQKEVPKDLKEKLASDIGEVQFTVKDPDGYDVKLNGKDIPEDVIETIRQNVITNVLPEYLEMREQFSQMKEELDRTKETVTQTEVESGIKHSLEFMRENPEFAVTVNKGEKLSEVLAGIFTAGETHPEYHNAQRFAVLATAIRQGIYNDFNSAYKGVFGKEIIRKNANEQVLNNQAQGAPEVPGQVPSSGSPILQRVASRNTKTARYNTLNR